MKYISTLAALFIVLGFAVPAAQAAECSAGYVQDLNGDYFEADGKTECTPPEGGTPALSGEPAPSISCPPGQVEGLGVNSGKCFDSAGKQTSATPSVQGAQSKAPGGVNASYLEYYRALIQWAINFVLLPVVIAVAFIVFIWGIVKAYILKPDDETARKQGHQLILWGIIGFVVIFSVWGIVQIVGSVLNLPLGGGAESRGLKPPTI